MSPCVVGMLLWLLVTRTETWACLSIDWWEGRWWSCSCGWIVYRSWRIPGSAEVPWWWFEWASSLWPPPSPCPSGYHCYWCCNQGTALRIGGMSISLLLGTGGILSGISGPPQCGGDVGHTPGVNENIINVDEDKPMKILPEHLVHEVLEYGGGID